MKNTNQLHKEHCYSGFGNHRIYPKTNKSLMLKSGKITRNLTEKEAGELIAEAQKGNFQGSANVVIEFSSDAAANKLAKSFSRLANNPSFKLDVTFKRINKNENNN